MRKSEMGKVGRDGEERRLERENDGEIVNL
ncbi:hypothetical protein EDC58_0839 [Caminibacter pacificus]|uniref:Uncharacterized protein n=1 Tax=Caminibacter pacificus TaxID=1424653 RepID=A0AAJ4RCQ7_9BACT|nr:hypothetical protein EDC58_0839 [Caminibacter pacificus]